MTVIVRPSARGVAVIVVFAISATLVSIVSALRVYVRLRIIKRQNSELADLSAAIGWLLFMSVSSLAIAGTFYGTGRPMELIPPENLVDIFKISWIYDIIYLVSQMAIKQSVTLTLLHYAVEEYHKKAIYAVTGLVHAVSTVLIAIVVFECIPLSFFWTRAGGSVDGRCIEPTIIARISYVYSGVIVLYDVVMALLPWLMVRKLQLDLRTRLMVTVVLALGSIACIATIVRVPLIIRESNARDLSSLQAVVNMISCSEMALSIIASSASTLKPLFRRASTQSTSNHSGKQPVLATIKPTPAGTSTASSAKECDMEFSTAFYGASK